MLGTRHEYGLQILEQHLDTFGHVNNASYLVLFEQARWEWITAGGYGLAEVQRLRIGPTILECSLRFLKELRLRERVTIQSWIESYVGKIAIVHQHIRSERGHTACQASFKMALFDVEQRRLILPTERWLQTFGLTAEGLNANGSSREGSSREGSSREGSSREGSSAEGPSAGSLDAGGLDADELKTEPLAR